MNRPRRAPFVLGPLFVFHQIQNPVLDELARAHVSLSCAIVLPLRIRGGAGSMVRPIAVGTPRR